MGRWEKPTALALLEVFFLSSFNTYYSSRSEAVCLAICVSALRIGTFPRWNSRSGSVHSATPRVPSHRYRSEVYVALFPRTWAAPVPNLPCVARKPLCMNGPLHTELYRNKDRRFGFCEGLPISKQESSTFVKHVSLHICSSSSSC